MSTRPLSRRRLLATGAVGAAALAIPGRAAAPAAAGVLPPWCSIPLAGFAATPEALLPELFAAELRVPPVAVPVEDAGGVDRYRIAVVCATAEILPGRETDLLTYDGTWPGPTIRAVRGRPVEVEVTNGHDAPVVVHLHGGVTAPEHDGHPLDQIAPGARRTYRYPNDQPGATLWYHDHVMHATARNVHAGLAGAYVLTDPAEDDALGLPDADHDLLWLLSDRTFDADGQLAYDPGPTHDGVPGDVLCVNGVPHPSTRLDRATYRVRVVNGSNNRPFGLRRADGVPWTQIGGDQGLLPAPVERDQLDLWPGERAELVMDLAAVAAGTSVTIEDVVAPEARRGLLRIAVGEATGPAVAVPRALRPIAATAAPTATREVLLSFASDTWRLNGNAFDAARIDATPRAGALERWRFRNPSAATHPMHLHQAHLRLVSRTSRQGQALTVQPWEEGWADTVPVHAGQTVEVDARFAHIPGTFVYHCHILEHEDHDMMAQLRVVGARRLAGAGRVETAVEVSATTSPADAPVAWVCSADGFADALAAGPAAAATGGPVLLTGRDALHPATAAELRRLVPERIVVVGGPSAVSEAVAQALAAIAPVERLAGPSRHATAAAVSAATFASAPVVHLATGDAFPDALGGGAAAVAVGGPLLLVSRDALPAETAAELARLAPGRVVVLGGTGAIGEAVAAAAGEAAGAPVERIAGPDRHATAAALSAATFAPRPDGVVVVATGQAFPDALAAAPLAGGRGPLLLVPPTGVPDVVTAEVSRLQPRDLFVVGGATAVPDAVVAALEALLDA